MADEVAELNVPVVPSVPITVADAPVVQGPVLEGEESARPHPLEPGGKRFEQVYAQSKQTQRDFEAEKERRIRAEAQLEAVTKPQQAREYEWDDLEVMITQGQITRAQAMSHREEVASKRMAAKLRSEFQAETQSATRVNTLTRNVYDYVVAVPDLNSVETPIRQRVDKEFDWLLAVQGRTLPSMSQADVKAMELTALRNVLGPIESLNKRVASPHIETHQGVSGGQSTEKKINPDQKLLDDLTPRQVEHYRRMISIGKYSDGWKGVVAELKFVPPARKF